MEHGTEAQQRIKIWPCMMFSKIGMKNSSRNQFLIILKNKILFGNSNMKNSFSIYSP